MSDKIRIEDSDDEAGGYEVTDSEDAYSEEEKEILEEIRKGRKKDESGRKELLAFADSDEEDDDDEEEAGEADGDDDLDQMLGDSDIEGAEENDDDMPDSMDWGKNKKTYYNTDFVDPDFDGYNEEQEDLALAEEEEAKSIQQRLAKQMKEDDFNIEAMFPSVKITESDDDEGGEPASKKLKVKKSQADFAGLSKREKEQLFYKDSPEFQGLLADYKNYFAEVVELIKPVLDYVKKNNVPMIPALQYAEFYQKLVLTYCTNINFYLLLKSKKIPVKYHPVTKRLVQFKKIINDVDDRHQNIIKPQLEALLERIQDGDQFVVNDPLAKKKKTQLSIMDAYNNKPSLKGQNKAKKVDEDLSEDDEDDSDDEKALEDPELGSEHEDAEDIEGEEAGDEESRRAITYQIAKNKGLTPHRKKELRNPRVKHRSKYRKALIRRKGAVRAVRTEVKRYGGEISGIKANVSKSIKIKV